ncbi:hypothetical protein FB567DRAFT_229297 [Paraphoma chrysanthemicola]|uniref:Uncharacterized protein n=1 Tax=Paraphoma chrysanthemicola TaxID=798071 RepID=A0A8K0RDW9_9PLEO|nr:hypothetical protein FB567DRAFT_229297 [Paraphoma chrysanthemicola]
MMLLVCQWLSSASGSTSHLQRVPKVESFARIHDSLLHNSEAFALFQKPHKSLNTCSLGILKYPSTRNKSFGKTSMSSNPSNSDSPSSFNGSPPPASGWPAARNNYDWRNVDGTGSGNEWGMPHRGPEDPGWDDSGLREQGKNASYEVVWKTMTRR